MKSFFLLAICLLIALNSRGQQKYTISGYIKDGCIGEVLTRTGRYCLVKC